MTLKAARMKLITFSIVLLATSIAPAQIAQPAAPTANAPAAAKKPFTPGDARFARVTSEVMQFQLKLAGRWNGIKELEPEFAKWLKPRHEKLTSIWTPLATMCVENNVRGLAEDVSKKDAADLAKNPNAKQEGFRLAHLELLAKSAKKGHKEMEAAAKGIQSAELKTWADNALTVMKTNADDYETRYQEEKKRK
jgi:hypothetical protein